MSNCLQRTSFAVLLSSMLFLAGCTTIAKQFYHEARGAQGEAIAISPISATTLAAYQGIELRPATTTVGDRLCPPPLLRAYDRSANQLASKLKTLFPGGTPVLRVDSEVLYYHGKGMMSGAFMLTRVHMYGDGQLVVDAMIRAESDAFRAGGEDALAQASIQALHQFLNQHTRGGPAE